MKTRVYILTHDGTEVSDVRALLSDDEVSDINAMAATGYTWKLSSSQVAENFDPRQPRDEYGQWASTVDVHSGTGVFVPKGNLGLSRKDMPQIQRTNRAAFFDELRLAGVHVSNERVKSKSLKPTQKEISHKVVKGIMDTSGDDVLTSVDSYPILISRDGYVLDGHHRWLAVLNKRADHAQSVVKIDMPIKRLLAFAKKSKVVTYKDTHESVGSDVLNTAGGILMDFPRARVVLTFPYVNEATTSRLARHFSQGSFGVMSAEREYMTPQQKKAASKRLFQRVRELGHGYIPVKGQYRYDDGKLAREQSVFIPGVDREKMLSLAKEFDQETVIHGAKGQASGFYADGREADWSKGWNDLGFNPDDDTPQTVTREAPRKTKVGKTQRSKQGLTFKSSDKPQTGRLKKPASDGKGQWITTKRGRHIFVGDDETPRQALQRSIGKSKNKVAESIVDRIDDLLGEGVSDPNILKAVFMAGGGGSGKSFFGNRMFKSAGLRVVNSDDAFEYLMRKHGLSLKTDVGTDKGQSLRPKAKEITAEKLESYIEGRLGLIIDGTGADPEKILSQKRRLESLGYDTSMVLVNAPLDVALSNNAKRDRVVPEDVVRQDWQRVQDAITKYKESFGDRNFVEIQSDKIVDKATMHADIDPKLAREASRLIERPLENPVGHEWLNRNAKGDTTHVTHRGKDAKRREAFGKRADKQDDPKKRVIKLGTATKEKPRDKKAAKGASTQKPCGPDNKGHWISTRNGPICVNEDFNPRQPRDGDGKWTDGGGKPKKMSADELSMGAVSGWDHLRNVPTEEDGVFNVTAEHDGRVIGNLIMSVDADGVGHVENIEVARPYRRRGIATHLYNYAKENHGVVKFAPTLNTNDGYKFRQKYGESVDEQNNDPLLGRGIMIRDPRGRTHMTLRTWLNRRRKVVQRKSDRRARANEDREHLQEFNVRELSVELARDDAIGKGEHEFFVIAKWRGHTVGYALYNTLRSDNNEIAYVRDVMSHQALRRKGIATAIYDWIKKEQGIKKFGAFGGRTPEGSAFRRKYGS